MNTDEHGMAAGALKLAILAATATNLNMHPIRMFIAGAAKMDSRTLYPRAPETNFSWISDF